MEEKNSSLPLWLKSFVNEQAAMHGSTMSADYVQEFIYKSFERRHLRGLLLQGAQSAPAISADGSYFEGLRCKVSSHGTK